MKIFKVFILIFSFYAFSVIQSCCTPGEPTIDHLKYDGVSISPTDLNTPRTSAGITEVNQADFGLQVTLETTYITKNQQPFQFGISTAYACDDGGYIKFFEDKIKSYTIYQNSPNTIDVTSYASVYTVGRLLTLEEEIEDRNNDPNSYSDFYLTFDENQIQTGETTFTIELELNSGIIFRGETESFTIL